jgi:ABC-type multidrug transport system fused ATPase/permease subunit
MGVLKSMWYGGFQFIANFFVFGSMCVIIYLGSYLHSIEKIEIGDITAFLLYMI